MYSDRTTLTVTVLVISTVIWFAWLYFLKPKIQRLPPGPPGVPFFGNLLSMDPDLPSYFAGLAQIYGPILKLRLGSKLDIVLTSPSMVRQVLKDQDEVFANRDVPAAGRAATYGGRDISWTPYGSEWRMLRKVCVVKMLSNSTLDSVYDLRRKEVRKTVSYLYSRVGCTVNVGEQVFVTVLNVITNMIWGGAEEGAERESMGAEFRVLMGEMSEILVKPNVSDFFPGLARFDLQGVVKQMDALVLQLDGIFERMIDQRVKMEGEEGKRTESKDFLQYLLNLKKEGSDSETPLTMTHVKALLMNLRDKSIYHIQLAQEHCMLVGEAVTLIAPRGHYCGDIMHVMWSYLE
ncbi:hypothetical protein VNO77_24874 [Canavalia gladiata]|uniref:Uncharacterized protein n=1 Tax=Canavalia gladiata TaxID=3824 RepID=A0AAN9L7S5_CANGL